MLLELRYNELKKGDIKIAMSEKLRRAEGASEGEEKKNPLCWLVKNTEQFAASGDGT